MPSSCLVGEHLAKRDVTEVLDSWLARVELVLDCDALARIDVESDIFEIKVFGVWPAALTTSATFPSSLWSGTN
jgi:hypothetical protein